MPQVPQVSVLMPVRNAATTLPVALRSVLRSRSIDLELVVVEHASTDDTRAILARFAACDARVHVVDAPASVDVAGALEIGRALCAAPFLARMDGDDVMHPDRLRAHVEHLTRHPTTAAIASRAKLIPRARARGSLASYVAWQNATISVDDHAREIW
ncbi:MAG TPA: glycosyltransferase family A protein, partial [Myxococcota bacterium]